MALPTGMIVALAAIGGSPLAAESHKSPREVLEPTFVIPPGFLIERVAGPEQVRFPMFAAFDDVGRLYVAESSGEDLYEGLASQSRECRLRRLEDFDGDGRFDNARVFVDKLVFPMGLAWHDGKLYVADPPDLVAFEDADSDGRGDARTIILSGFGHRDNGSLHGLIFGPDGRLYMTMGSPDGYRLRRADGSVIEGQSGALIRCQPDGADPEVVCRGFVNLVEIAFTSRGEILGTDNWFRNVNQLGSNGLRDALVHLIEGGLYPYEHDVGAPQPVTGVSLDPVGLYPAVALSGVECYRGTNFPSEMVGNLFTAQHNSRKVVRHVLQETGSTFRALDTDFVTTDDPDFHPSDVVEAADGSLLVIDTGSWYTHHCPTGSIRLSHAQGGIYRVRRAEAAAPLDPWGEDIDWNSESLDALIGLLVDQRPAVVDGAMVALVHRGQAAVPGLGRVASRGTNKLAAQCACWTLGRIGNDEALMALRSALHDKDADLVATAARALAMRGDRLAAPQLCELLASQSVAVRLAAAEALAHCGDASSLESLWTSLADDPEAMVEHAVIHAIHRLADADQLEAALDDHNPRVRRAALLLLSQPPRPPERLTDKLVLANVIAPDRDLREAALSILSRHPEWAESSLALLSGWLREPRLSEQQTSGLHSILLAFQENAALQELAGTALLNADGETPVRRRVEVLETLAQCSLSELPASWISVVYRLIDEAEPEVQAQAVHTAAIWQSPRLAAPLRRFADDNTHRPELRIEALRASIVPGQQLTDGAFGLLVSQFDQDADPLVKLRGAEILRQATLSDAQLGSLIAALRKDMLVSPDVILPALDSPRNTQVAIDVLDYLAGAIRGGWRPNEQSLQRALRSLPVSMEADADKVRKLWQESDHQNRGQLERLEPLLRGGDPRRGRAVFLDPKVGCAVCHRVGVEGGAIGPDLTRIGTVRAPRDLLEAIALPSATIAQGFDVYTVVTYQGQTFVGVISRQDDQVVVVRDTSGAERRFGRGEIEQIERRTNSLMPDGLANALTPDQFRDLLAYVQALK